jgi:hypothetical protein
VCGPLTTIRRVKERKGGKRRQRKEEEKGGRRKKEEEVRHGRLSGVYLTRTCRFLT